MNAFEEIKKNARELPRNFKDSILRHGPTTSGSSERESRSRLSVRNAIVSVFQMESRRVRPLGRSFEKPFGLLRK